MECWWAQSCVALWTPAAAVSWWVLCPEDIIAQHFSHPWLLQSFHPFFCDVLGVSEMSHLGWACNSQLLQNFHQLGIYALTSAHFKSRAFLTKTDINFNLCYKHKYLESSLLECQHSRTTIAQTKGSSRACDLPTHGSLTNSTVPSMNSSWVLKSDQTVGGYHPNSHLAITLVSSLCLADGNLRVSQLGKTVNDFRPPTACIWHPGIMETTRRKKASAKHQLDSMFCN